jgi:hypothetical protein
VKDFDAGAAIGARLVATVVMTTVLYMGIAMMPKQMTMKLLYMLGTMMTRSTAPAYLVGAMMHAMMGIVFALIHAVVYAALDIGSALVGWGLLLGLAHWAIVGIGLGMVGMMHTMIRSGEMMAPGVFVKNHPPMTVMGFLMLHLIYGLVVDLLYEAWV